jgi:putative ABC transport system permease protein
MTTFIQDVRHSMRRLRRAPGLALTATLTLAVGIGATTIVYSVVKAVLLNSLPYPKPERLYILRESEKDMVFSVAYPNFQDWRTQSHSFDAMSGYFVDHFQYFDGEHTSLPRGARVSASFFPMLGAQPELGRVFGAPEDQPGAAPVVVLSHSFWLNQMHADPNVLGRTVTLSGKPYTVTGVMSPRFRFFYSRSPDFYLPLGALAGDSHFNSRTAHGSMQVLARLRDGVTESTARAEMEAVAKRVAAENPATNGGHGVYFIHLVTAFASDYRPTLWMLMAAVLLVLLVAAANVSNLLLTQGTERAREYAIRSALGASGGRILRESLIDTLCLSLAGGAAGVALAYALLPQVLRLAPQTIPRLNETAIGLPVLGFALGLSALVAAFCGAVPAWSGARVAPELALRAQTSMMATSRGRQLLRSALLVGGVAVTVVLTAGSGLLIQSLRSALASNPGFEPDHLLTLDIVLEGDKYKDPAASRGFFSSAEERLRALPGVKSVGVVGCPPATGECGDYFYSIPGQTVPDTERLPVALFNFADGDYFGTAGVHIVSGRAFQPTDTVDSPQVVVVNQTLARQWWPNGDAVGHTIHYGGRGEKGVLLQIVGVMNDVKQYGLDTDPDPEFFFAASQRANAGMVLMARTEADPLALRSAAEAAVQTVDKEVPIRIHTMDELLNDSLHERRFMTVLLSSFTGVALFLAALGIFGLAAYAVSSRKPEIGLRMALGARPNTVQRWISALMLRRVALGCAIGVAASVFALRLMRSLLYGVSPLNPAALAAACAVLLAIATLATWLPARRAAAIDPMQTLRSE